MRFFHSADWQIGARFRQFAEKSGELRAIRLRTLRNALSLAAQRQADAFLIAGDLFEDHGVAAGEVAAVWTAFAEAPEVPIFILPGNHDPAGGPSTIWNRPPFSTGLSHVKVIAQPETIAIGSGWLLANPLRQKRSTVDPSLAFVDMAAALPPGVIKVGMTHGSPAIESMHEPDDFPIAVNAATRAGLDYLAIGHWHSEFLQDGNRLVMPGTPEQTDFGEKGAGNVIEVEIDAPGTSPRLTRHRVGQLRWLVWEFDLADAETARSRADQLQNDIDAPEKTLLRIKLAGAASPQAVQEFTAHLQQTLGTCLVVDVRDATTPELTLEELEELKCEHPLLELALRDLETIGGGGSAYEGVAPPSLPEIAEVLNCTAADLTPALALRARKLLLAELNGLRASC
jgi:DNA repair exonuclease SbcCD nuclease subunit